MTTITEDYVSFEIAKLLKEKGFNESIETLIGPEGIVYNLDENGISRQKHSTISNSEINIYSEDVSCPTIQMACKWLRKKHNVFISPVFIDESYEGAEEVEPYYGFTVEDVSTKKFLATSKSTHYDEPENACEAAIKYCLENLI